MSSDFSSCTFNSDVASGLSKVLVFSCRSSIQPSGLAGLPDTSGLPPVAVLKTKEAQGASLLGNIGSRAPFGWDQEAVQGGRLSVGKALDSREPRPGKARNSSL